MTRDSKNSVEQELWATLKEIPDPEIPVVTLVEMGIIRAVSIEDSHILVTITPTFSGCPALHVMKDEIVTKINQLGHDSVEVQVVYAPPWTTDWITPSARNKLKEFGIFPPTPHGGKFEIMLQEIIPCPYCSSRDTEVRNQFGPTPCRALAYCHNCQQPFEWFKPI